MGLKRWGRGDKKKDGGREAEKKCGKHTNSKFWVWITFRKGKTCVCPSDRTSVCSYIRLSYAYHMKFLQRILFAIWFRLCKFYKFSKSSSFDSQPSPTTSPQHLTFSFAASYPRKKIFIFFFLFFSFQSLTRSRLHLQCVYFEFSHVSIEKFIFLFNPSEAEAEFGGRGWNSHFN